MQIVMFTCTAYHYVIPIFYHFWKKNWPTCPYQLVFVTGSGEIEIPDDPQVTIVYQGEDRGYASNAIAYLSGIEDKHVLLMQEDFILHSVRPEMVIKAVELCNHPDVGCVRLGGVPGPDWQFNESGGEGFGEIDKANADWVFSMQSAIWNVDTFLGCIQWGDSPWQAEHKGTERAQRRPERFLCSEQRVLDYEQYCTLGENIETEVQWVKEHWNDGVASVSLLNSDTVTAHLMIRDEEYWIGFILENLVKHLSNIFVFDTGSNDATIGIVKSFPKVTLVEKGPLNPKELCECRNEMMKMTQTPWAWTVDGDEWYPEKAVKALLEQEMPAGKKVGFTQLLDVGWDGDNFRAYLPFSRVAVLAQEARFADNVAGHGYPYEMPNLFHNEALYHYFDGISGYHLHHLLRSSRDKDVYLRVDKRHRFSMQNRDIPLGEILEIPFGKARWPNPYFK